MDDFLTEEEERRLLELENELNPSSTPLPPQVPKSQAEVESPFRDPPWMTELGIGIANQVSDIDSNDVLSALESVPPLALGTAAGTMTANPWVGGIVGNAVSSGTDFVIDQINQLLGYEKDTPIQDDIRDTAKNIGQGSLVDLGINTLFRGGGSVLNRVGQTVEDIISPAKSKIRVFSGGPSDLDTGIASQKLENVIGRLEETPLHDTAVGIAKSETRTPFTEFGEAMSETGKTLARDVDSFVDQTTKQVSFGDVFDPNALRGLGTGTDEANWLGRRAAREFDAQASRILSPDEMTLLSTAKRDRLAAERALAKSSIQGTAPDPSLIQKLTNAEAMESSLTEKVMGSRLSARDLVNQRKVYDSAAGWGQDEMSGIGARRLVADRLRTAEESLIEQSLGAEQAAAYRAAKQSQSDLLRVEGPIQSKSQVERRGSPDSLASQELRIGTGIGGQVMGRLKNLAAGDPSASDFRRAFNPNAMDRSLMVGSQMAQGAGRGLVGLTNNVPLRGAAGSYMGLSPENEAEASPLDGIGYNQVERGGMFKGNGTQFGPREGFTFPRVVNDSPEWKQTVNLMLNGFMPPEQAGPLMLQWNKLAASGNREQMAQFLGLVTEQFPDFPFQIGGVTGLPSEFDIGDGLVRLFSDADKAKWEEKVNNSDLSTDEKAIRVRMLRQSGQVVPFDLKIRDRTPQAAPVMSERDSAVMRTPAMNEMLRYHRFAKRISSPLGSRRAE